MSWHNQSYRHSLAARGIHTNYAMKFYKVGGAVRDELMGKKPSDVDWVVVGATEQEMAEKYGEPVGKKFGVYLGEVPGHPGKVEIAMARTESKIPGEEGHKAFDVRVGPDISLEEDLRRRDFTVNAMAYDPETGQIIDPYGGKQDIEAGILRHVDERAFAEDPLRVLRLARFRSKLGFQPDPKTIELAKSIDISSLPSERILGETEKALMTSKPSLYFTTLDETGTLKQVVPELLPLKGLPHRHQEDAFTHAMMALDRSADFKLPVEYRMAVLGHDLGKGTTPKEMLPRHHEHEMRSKELTKNLMNRLQASNKVRDTAVWFAANHMRVHDVPKMSEAKLTSFAEDIVKRGLDVRKIAAASMADAQGRVGGYHEPIKGPGRLVRAVDVIKDVKADDIVAKGYKGPIVGKLLHEKRVHALKEAGI